MSLDPKFGAAFIDGHSPFSRLKAHRVLGKPLRPFCLWHLVLLRAVDSPFLRKGDIALFDLKNAVAVCRLAFGDSRIKRPRWPLALPRKKLAREVLAFLAYTGDYVQCKPEYAVITREDPNAPPSRSVTPPPDELMMAGDIIGWRGCTDEYVWNLPLGQAHWQQAMAIRARGSLLDFVDEEDRAFGEEMEAAGCKPAV